MTDKHISKRLRILALIPLLGTLACLDGMRPIEWLDDNGKRYPRPENVSGLLESVVDSMPESAEPYASVMALPVIETPPAPNLELGDMDFPMDSLRCDMVPELRNSSLGQVAVWWSLRSNGRVHLLSAWRDKGQTTWRGPIVVDSMDRGSTDARDVSAGIPVGCSRPTPGLSVDGTNGYVHVAYPLVGPQGPGIFYAHQMDPRAQFEPAVPIVYGERLGAARVGSDGDLVAVSYEDPNSGSRIRIALAVSKTGGHIFERREMVTAGLNPAFNPYVHVKGTAIAMAWNEVPPSGGDTTLLVRRAKLR